MLTSRQLRLWSHPVRNARFAWARQRGEPALSVPLDDGTLLVDPQDDRVGRTLFVLRSYEPLETALVQGHLRPGMTFVDVGAHVGYYSVVAAKAVGPTGHVLAFEPSPRNHDLLVQNLQATGHPDARAVHAAVGAENGATQLYLAEGNMGGHQAFPGDHARKAIDVALVRLDDVLAERGLTPDLVKMDIEGYEGHALAGLEETLSQDRPMALLLEFTPKHLRTAGTDPLDLLERLEGHGFELAIVPKGDQGTPRPGSPASILETVEAQWPFADLFCQRVA